MATLEYNEIRERKFIVLDGDPYEVLDSHVFRKQQRKPVNHTKLRNIISGKVTERAFGAMETAQEAEIGKKKVKYLFKKENRQTEETEYWFCPPNDPKDRFFITGTLFGDGRRFIKENTEVDAVLFDEKIIGIKLPIKMTLKVTEAAPAVRGNTVNNTTKQVTLETGATIQVPMFIEQDEYIIVNTETGEYVERGNK
jgi:elongation factor P